MTHIQTQADLDAAIRQLCRGDRRLEAVLETSGMPTLRRRQPGFAGLAHIICGQQLSTASAGAIWARLSAAFEPFEPQALRRARNERLARLGLSAAKIKTLKNLALELTHGRIDLDALASASAEVAHQTLVALPGIGPWTADLYLLFCLGHCDAWPVGDLALQESIRCGFGLATRPTRAAMVELADAWRPWRGAAAHLWWHYYHVIKGRDGVIASQTIT